jgi:hypothetical protein
MIGADAASTTAATAMGDWASFDAGTGSVRYQLAQPALVSAGVFDAQGRLVRTLASMQAMPAGTYSAPWDGTDDFGRPTPPGAYAVRVVVNRNSYENVGAIGGSADDPSIAQHIPTTMLSVAVDATGAIYTANSWDEPGADFKKWTAQGDSVYDAEFKIRNGNPNGAPYRVATDDTYMYYAVGAWSGQQQIQRFRLADGSPAPFSGETLVGGHIQVYRTVEGLLNPDTPANDRELMTSPLSALAVSGDVLYVADAAGNRVLRFDKNSGAPLGQFSVTLPQALAVDQAGRVWVGHQHGTVSVFTAEGGFLGHAIQGLGSVAALAFGPQGHLYVADQGTGQVKVFQVNGTRADLSWTLGQAAVPGDRDPSHFYTLRGVAVDPGGNIVTVQTEPVGGARLARWSPTGALLWEHFGNEFVSLGNYGQDNPDQFYSMTFHRYELTEPSTGSWEYLGNTFPGGQSYSSNPHGVPRVLTIGGVEFFFDPTGDGMQVYRIDGATFHLVTLVGGQDPAPDGSLRSLPTGQWTWSDINGTGQPTADEIRWFRPPGLASYRTLGMDVDRQGNIWFADQASGGLWEIPLGALDARGNPTYDWSSARQVIARDTSDLGFQPQMVQRADDGSIYAFGWSVPWASGGTELWMGGTTLVKFSAGGERLWAVRLPEICTGMDTIPGLGGVMVGGGKSATIYQYNADGLRIGSMAPGAAMAGISSWLDNQASVAVSRDPRDGWLDVFTEDNYGLRIGWYRVDDRRSATLVIALSPSSNSSAPPPKRPVGGVSPPVVTAPLPSPVPPIPAAPSSVPPASSPATLPDPTINPAPLVAVGPVAAPPQPSPPAGESVASTQAPPPPPQAPILRIADSAVMRGNRVLALRRPFLLGATVRGGAVELLDDQGRVLGMTIASPVDGSFAIQPVRNLKVGKVRVRLRVRDAAGRQSEPGAALTLNVTTRQSQGGADPFSVSAQRAAKPHGSGPPRARNRAAALLREPRKTHG